MTVTERAKPPYLHGSGGVMLIPRRTAITDLSLLLLALF